MAIFDFGILSGYIYSGVDSALGLRAQLLRENGADIKFIYVARPDIAFPWKETMQEYMKWGIDISQMLTPYHIMTGRKEFLFTDTVDDILDKLKGIIDYSDAVSETDGITLKRGDIILAKLYIWQSNFVYRIDYYSSNTVSFSEYYSDGLLYSEIKEEGYVRRSFVDKRKKILFDEEINGNEQNGKKIRYRFENGEVVCVEGFWRKVIGNLQLTRDDVCILDRPGYLEYQAPLFELNNGAEIITVFHSAHHFKMNENIGSVGMNYEYYYWLRNTEHITRMVVGTEEQRDSLYSILKEYGRFIPRIEVIPPGVLQSIPVMEEEGKISGFEKKRPYSLVTVSRIEYGKQIRLLIDAVAKAHESISEIDFCIYGNGFESNIQEMQSRINNLNAQDYIHYMGYQDVSKVYSQAEVYLSASLVESFGLTLLEAQVGGCALIGLDVRYGNRLFIKPGENGYLVDFDIERDWDHRDKVAEEMADRIVELFSDRERLRRFQRASYQMAVDFKEENSFGRWLEILPKEKKDTLDL